MPSSLVNVNLENVSAPATALIERVSDAIGGIARPYQIVRIAKAEAKANAIATQSDIEIAQLRIRVVRRFINEQTRDQLNIERITYRAIPHLNADSEPGQIDDDFVVNLFDKSRLVSEEQVQDIWARILAGKANNPGTISRKTINILADMEKRGADLFTQLCLFVWAFPKDTEPVIYSQEDLWKRNDMSFGALTDLESVGLIRIESSVLGQIGTDELPQTSVASYFGRHVEITSNDRAGGRVPTGEVAFSSSGRQIYSIVEPIRLPGLFEAMTR